MEWSGPAILFACLIFTLTAPKYICYFTILYSVMLINSTRATIEMMRAYLTIICFFAALPMLFEKIATIIPAQIRIKPKPFIKVTAPFFKISL